MLITFKSRAASDVIMFGDVAARMLEVMGKDAKDPCGIITKEQLASAIEKLSAAAAADKARAADASRDETTQANDEDHQKAGNAVSFAQRAAPLIDLMRYALRDGEPVIWES